MYFNAKDGFLEAILRGYLSELLKTSDYNNLCQCETLDDLKLQLSGTCYAASLQDESANLHPTTLVERCVDQFLGEFNYLRCNAEQPLAQFLDYCTYGHMIDNVVLIVTGTLHERDVQELLEKCHPLGMFDGIASLAVAQTVQDIYKIVLIDTPLAKYFSENLSSEDLDEMNVEILRNTLYRAYLRDFLNFCSRFNPTTRRIMGQLLCFEADRRTINIALNSLHTDLSSDDKAKLFSDFGALYPHAGKQLASAQDAEQVTSVLESYPAYADIFNKMRYDETQMLDKFWYEKEMGLSRDAFQEQFHYAIFYAYFKLKEQEIRNIMWVGECIAQQQRTRIHDGIVVTNV